MARTTLRLCRQSPTPVTYSPSYWATPATRSAEGAPGLLMTRNHLGHLFVSASALWIFRQSFASPMRAVGLLPFRSLLIHCHSFIRSSVPLASIHSCHAFLDHTLPSHRLAPTRVTLDSSRILSRALYLPHQRKSKLTSLPCMSVFCTLVALSDRS